MRKCLVFLPLIALAGCGGNGGGGGGGGTAPTFTRTLLNGSFAESGVVTGAGGQAVGSARATGATAKNRQAVTWSLAAGSAPTNLHPASRSGSELFAVSDSLFVGWTLDSGGMARAALWNRAAGNALAELSGSLTESRAYGVSGNLVGGQGRPSGAALHAFVWNHASGDAATDLNGSFTASSAYGVDGAKVVGFGTASGVDRATLWDTAAGNAVTDLHPAGSGGSQARGISGSIVAGSSGGHAGFWNLASGNVFTDLTPTGSGKAFATNGRFVVGIRGSGAFTTLSSELATTSRATLWDRDNGNALVDLHALYLSDQGYEWSAALGVDAAGNIYGVGGAVVDDFNANYRAWVLVKS